MAQVQCGRRAHWNTRTFWPLRKCARTHTVALAKTEFVEPLGRLRVTPAQPKVRVDSQWRPALHDGSRLVTPPAARAARNRQIRVRARAPRSPTRIPGSSPTPRFAPGRDSERAPVNGAPRPSQANRGGEVRGSVGLIGGEGSIWLNSKNPVRVSDWVEH